MSGTFTRDFDTSIYKGSITLNTGLFINGQFVSAVDRKTVDVLNPADGSVITTVARGNAKDVKLAVEAAHKAFKTSWGLKVPGFERGRLLYKLTELVEHHADALAALEALDAGKKLGHARHEDIQAIIDNLRYFAGWADKNHGQTIETHEGKFAYTRREPIGVTGLIVPWNFPLLIAIWKIAPALATGNTVVLKPSEVTPLTALKFAELVKEAGFPDGVFNVVTGSGLEAGQAISEHPLVGMVSFTGSTVVGRKIVETAAKTNLKRVTLELGGKNPVVVFDDADLEQAVKWVTPGAFHHNGQVCLSGSRIYVQEAIYDKFISAFAERARTIRQGDGLNADVDEGPMVSKAHLNRVFEYIETGKQEGARLVLGGARADRPGYFIQPTIFADVTPDMRIAREEIFGPVGVVSKFKSDEEVVALANDSEYGLAAYVYTQNISRAINMAHQLEVGSTFINSAALVFPQVPFGGTKQSGFGKSMSEYALDAFTQVKAVHVNLGISL